MNQEFKDYLLANGFTQGGSKTTENNFSRGTIEIVLLENGFEHRKIIAGSVAYRTPFIKPELYQLKQVVSGERGALFVASIRVQNEEKPKHSARSWAWRIESEPNFFDKYEINMNTRKGRLYVEKAKS
jgi:hypothetical protein